MGPSAHNVCAEYDIKLNQSHLPVHGPQISIPCTSMYLSKSLLNATVVSAPPPPHSLSNTFLAPTTLYKKRAPHISIKSSSSHLITVPSNVGHFHPGKKVLTVYLFMALIILYTPVVSPNPLTFQR